MTCFPFLWHKPSYTNKKVKFELWNANMRNIKTETWEQLNSNYLINYGFMALSLPNFSYLNKARLVKKEVYAQLYLWWQYKQ